SICAGTNCPPLGNVLSVDLAWDYDDNAAHCVAKPEQCGNHLDDDCNAATDDSDSALCDGPDLDGCALGHASCDSQTCLETATVPRLDPPPGALLVAAGAQ